MKTERPLIAIIGETASGKTSVAIDIAQTVGGEILCADSRTVYKQLDIGTAKPSVEEQVGIPHHLLDIVEPNEKFSVAQFQAMAQKCIQDIQKRGKIPILVGGTGLYIDAVLYNYQFPKPQSTYRRETLEQMDDVEITTLLKDENIDIAALNTKNRRHVVNALLRLGRSGTRSKLPKSSLIVGLRLDREVLKTRISQRVEQMFADGFLGEVKQVADRYGWDHESMSGIGYRVARSYLEGSASVDQVKEAFVTRDISLAKRQRTWFKRNKDILWFDNPKLLKKEVVEFVSDFNYNKS